MENVNFVTLVLKLLIYNVHTLQLLNQAWINPLGGPPLRDYLWLFDDTEKKLIYILKVIRLDFCL